MLRKILFISALISLVTVGCKKDFLDQNVDPNYPSSIPPSKILPAALSSTSYLMIDQNLDFANIWMGFWSFSSTYGIPANQRDYDYPASSDKQGFFNAAYSNAFDYQNIINQSIASKNKAMEGIGRIMKSMVVQMVVDVYGDAPYTQALLGTVNQTPKYDNASAVYDSLYNDISTGIADINMAQPADFPSATSDLMFQGNKALWIKFANTLKLKLLIRQSNVASKAAYIQAKLADFGGSMAVFLQPGDIAKINPGYNNSASSKQTPYWNVYGYSLTGTVATGSEADYYRAGINSIHFFAAQNDLRLLQFMDYSAATALTANPPTPVGQDTAFLDYVASSVLGANLVFAGTEMGVAPVAAAGYSLPPFSNLCTNKAIPVRTASNDALIFSDFESLFLQAEAAQRGWITGDAQGLFDTAVAHSFAYTFDAPIAAMGGPATGGGSSIMSDLVPTTDNDWATATGAGIDPIQLIVTQKYMALAGYNNLEPWAEYRRTGFPNVKLSTNPSSKGKIPLRYLYPQREYSVNGNNVPLLVSGDQFNWQPGSNGKIFWVK